MHDIGYLAPSLSNTLSMLEVAHDHKYRIFIMANGEGSAISLHFVLDLAKNAIQSGTQRIKAVPLARYVSLITAWSNNMAYEHVFKERLSNSVESKEAIIGISTACNAHNAIDALRLARQNRALTISLLGYERRKIKHRVAVYILVPGQNI